MKLHCLFNYRSQHTHKFIVCITPRYAILYCKLKSRMLNFKKITYKSTVITVKIKLLK